MSCDNCDCPRCKGLRNIAEGAVPPVSGDGEHYLLGPSGPAFTFDPCTYCKSPCLDVSCPRRGVVTS